MVDDKSQLEREIERREIVKKPLSVLILIALLSVSLGALGVYTFKLRQELLVKKEEIVLIKREFNNEKVNLINKIKRLEREREALKSNLEFKPITNRLTTTSQTEAPQGKGKKHNEE